MFENLSEKLDSAFKQLKGQGRITELNVAATVKDIRRALIDADVNFKIAKDFTDTIRQKALGQKVLTAVSPEPADGQVVQDELTERWVAMKHPTDAKGNPAVIPVAGLQGSSKTTSAQNSRITSKHRRSFSSW
jgi:signal recognition particle subunit SRP54